MPADHPAQALERLCTCLIMGILALATVLWAFWPGSYEQIIQEDGPVEWMTFWAFVFAGGFALLALAGRVPGSNRLRSLYLLVFGLGCLAIAMEEISWGQRLLGYRPPVLFLTSNDQLELNLHNLAAAGTRKALLTTLLIGFGILFPLLGRQPTVSGWLSRLEIRSPSLALLPGYVALTMVYLLYPWNSTGEWVELGAGVGFLFHTAGYLQGSGFRRRMLLVFTPMVLGSLTPLIITGAPDPARIVLAEQEAAALAADFRDRRLRSRCGVHKRIYTFVQEYGAAGMDAGAYGGLNPADVERRRYFLDPWNMPYWIWHGCSRDRQQSTAFVYSFGPNRRRDSTEGTLLPDDVGSYVRSR